MCPVSNIHASIVLTWLFLQVTSAQQFYKVGDTVDLSPGPVSGKITSVTWKHGSDIAMEAFGSDITYYRGFKGRCGFNTSTGVLTIGDLALSDSGTYKAEVNSRDAGSQDLRVLSPVPKPTVSVECNEEVTFCNLTCNFETSPEMGDVDQTWVVDGKDKLDSGSQKMSITDKTKNKEFICKLKNFVDTKSSDAVLNLFLNRGGGNTGTVVFLVILAILIILLIGFFIVYRTTWFDSIGVIHNLRGNRFGNWLRSTCKCGHPSTGQNNAADNIQNHNNSALNLKTANGPETSNAITDPPETQGLTANEDKTSADVHTHPATAVSTDPPELSDEGVTPAKDESSVKLMAGDPSSTS
uniref:Ig-like domain-containing protein n=1 Tax=Iconisemion striatum TaxID=60296 RepID=A0A1A7XSH1_9TELE